MTTGYEKCYSCMEEMGARWAREEIAERALLAEHAAQPERVTP